MLRALGAALLVVAAAVGCSKPPPETLHLEEGILTVNNRTPEDWVGVEIWLNRNFRVTVPSIAAGSQFTVPLNAFVAAYGQRYDRSRMQLTDLRLTAKTRGGTPVEETYRFRQGGLEGAFGGKQ